MAKLSPANERAIWLAQRIAQCESKPEVLLEIGIRSDSCFEEATRLYRAAARLIHPDKLLAQEAPNAFKALSEAFASFRASALCNVVSQSKNTHHPVATVARTPGGSPAWCEYTAPRGNAPSVPGHGMHAAPATHCSWASASAAKPLPTFVCSANGPAASQKPRASLDVRGEQINDDDDIASESPKRDSRRPRRSEQCSEGQSKAVGTCGANLRSPIVDAYEHTSSSAPRANDHLQRSPDRTVAGQQRLCHQQCSPAGEESKKKRPRRSNKRNGVTRHNAITVSRQLDLVSPSVAGSGPMHASCGNAVWRRTCGAIPLLCKNNQQPQFRVSQRNGEHALEINEDALHITPSSFRPLRADVADSSDSLYLSSPDSHRCRAATEHASLDSASGPSLPEGRAWSSRRDACNEAQGPAGGCCTPESKHMEGGEAAAGACSEASPVPRGVTCVSSQHRMHEAAMASCAAVPHGTDPLPVASGSAHNKTLPGAPAAATRRGGDRSSIVFQSHMPQSACVLASCAGSRRSPGLPVATTRHALQASPPAAAHSHTVDVLYASEVRGHGHNLSDSTNCAASDRVRPEWVTVLTERASRSKSRLADDRGRFGRDGVPLDLASGTLAGPCEVCESADAVCEAVGVVPGAAMEVAEAARAMHAAVNAAPDAPHDLKGASAGHEAKHVVHVARKVSPEAVEAFPEAVCQASKAMSAAGPSGIVSASLGEAPKDLGTASEPQRHAKGCGARQSGQTSGKDTPVDESARDAPRPGFLWKPEAGACSQGTMQEAGGHDRAIPETQSPEKQCRCGERGGDGGSDMLEVNVERIDMNHEELCMPQAGAHGSDLAAVHSSHSQSLKYQKEPHLRHGDHARLDLVDVSIGSPGPSASPRYSPPPITPPNGFITQSSDPHSPATSHGARHSCPDFRVGGSQDHGDRCEAAAHNEDAGAVIPETQTQTSGAHEGTAGGKHWRGWQPSRQETSESIRVLCVPETQTQPPAATQRPNSPAHSGNFCARDASTTLEPSGIFQNPFLGRHTEEFVLQERAPKAGMGGSFRKVRSPRRAVRIALEDCTSSEEEATGQDERDLPTQACVGSCCADVPLLIESALPLQTKVLQDAKPADPECSMHARPPVPSCNHTSTAWQVQCPESQDTGVERLWQEALRGARPKRQANAQLECDVNDSRAKGETLCPIAQSADTPAQQGQSGLRQKHSPSGRDSSEGTEGPGTSSPGETGNRKSVPRKYVHASDLLIRRFATRSKRGAQSSTAAATGATESADGGVSCEPSGLGQRGLSTGNPGAPRASPRHTSSLRARHIKRATPSAGDDMHDGVRSACDGVGPSEPVVATSPQLGAAVEARAVQSARMGEGSGEGKEWGSGRSSGLVGRTAGRAKHGTIVTGGVLTTRSLPRSVVAAGDEAAEEEAIDELEGDVSEPSKSKRRPRKKWKSGRSICDAGQRSLHEFAIWQHQAV